MKKIDSADPILIFYLKMDCDNYNNQLLFRLSNESTQSTSVGTQSTSVGTRSASATQIIETTDGLMAAALNHPSAKSITPEPIQVEYESEDEIDDSDISDCENEITERFTISDHNREPGIVAVTLNEDEETHRFTIYHDRKAGIVAVTLREDEIQRVKWAPGPPCIKEFIPYKIPDYWQSGCATEKAKEERRKEYFWDVLCHWKINEKQWRRYCQDHE